jgi:GR25 family glycosyltransferase involved in LPS biosynthesis
MNDIINNLEVSQRVKDRLLEREISKKGSPLSDHVDKVYVINLDSRPDRLSDVTEEMNKFGIEFIRFSAVNGSNLPQVETGHINSHRNSGSWNKNALGLVKTTINIIEDAKLNGYESILIFEDDVELEKNVQLIFTRAKNELPDDWEMFHFGIFHKTKPKRFSKFLVQVSGGVCCHAYMIHSRVYDIYLDALKREDSPIDIVTLENIHTRGKSFSLLSNFAYQKLYSSNITEGVADHGYLRRFSRP